MSERSYLMCFTEDRRLTFDVPHHSREEFLLPPDSSLRKRHQTSPVVSDDMSRKKMRDKESAEQNHESPVYGVSALYSTLDTLK